MGAAIDIGAIIKEASDAARGAAEGKTFEMKAFETMRADIAKEAGGNAGKAAGAVAGEEAGEKAA